MTIAPTFPDGQVRVVRSALDKKVALACRGRTGDVRCDLSVWCLFGCEG